MQFEIGDKVTIARRVEEYSDWVKHRGESGTIIEEIKNPEHFDFRLEWENGETSRVPENVLEFSRIDNWRKKLDA